MPGFIFLGVLILLVILLTPFPVLAKPPITWTPGEFFETVPPGKSKLSWVSFTSSEDMTNVNIRVVPKLAPYLQVDPNILTSIKAGTPVSLMLTFAPAADATLGTFDGTIQIKSAGKPSKTFAKPLPVTLEIKVSTPETVLLDLISDLTRGDIEAVLSKLEPTQKNRDFFTQLTSEDLKELAIWFQNAQLVKRTETYRVYETGFTDGNGQSQTVEFIMILNTYGEWIIGGL